MNVILCDELFLPESCGYSAPAFVEGIRVGRFPVWLDKPSTMTKTDAANFKRKNFELREWL